MTFVAQGFPHKCLSLIPWGRVSQCMNVTEWISIGASIISTYCFRFTPAEKFLTFMLVLRAYRHCPRGLYFLSTTPVTGREVGGGGSSLVDFTFLSIWLHVSLHLASYFVPRVFIFLSIWLHISFYLVSRFVLFDFIFRSIWLQIRLYLALRFFPFGFIFLSVWLLISYLASRFDLFGFILRSNWLHISFHL